MAHQDPVLAGAGWSAVSFDPATDGPAIADLFDACADFLILESGEPASPTIATDYFDDVPEGHPADRMLRLGIRRADGGLVGMLDVVIDFREPGAWFIGLFMLRPQARGAGLGSAVIDALKAYARIQGARTLGLAVYQVNPRGIAFWRQAGFEITETMPTVQVGNKQHVRHRMRLTL